MTNFSNTIIIGAGPAGLSAAIQLGRVGHDFRIFEKSEVGGLLLNANLVENYPGFPMGISGAGLVEIFKKQIERLRITVSKAEVSDIDCSNNLFQINTNEGKYKSKNLIIATGTKPIQLNPEMISDSAKDKVFYEVWPMRNIKEKEIAIIGSGDAAFDYALNLAKKNKVSILYRSIEPKCHQLLLEEVSRNSHIEQYSNFKIDEIAYDTRFQIKSADQLLTADRLLVAIGREPNLDIIETKIRNQMLEKIKTPGLYYAGDVQRGIFRQVAIAVGDGIKAAMECIKE